jgi:N-acetylglucosaminyl-diphospho-decaprenol L-rhamnosyltransferase
MTEMRTPELEAVGSKAVDVLLVSFNSAHLLRRLRDTLDASAPGRIALRLLAVDNASTDRSAEILRRYFSCDVFIQNRLNVGFGRANNQLLEHVRSDYVLLLNTDAFVSPETIAVTVDYMDAHPRCGILGVRLTNRDGSLQPSRRKFPTPFTTFVRRSGLERWLPLPAAGHDLEEDHGSVADCDWVPGCYYLVRRAVLDEIGLFDPRFFLYFEEVDHCRRAHSAGWTVTYLPSTSVVHIGGESAKSVAALSRDRQISVLEVESELLYMRKHFGLRGLLVQLLLTPLADAILAAKDLVRARGLASGLSRFRVTQVTWGLAARTRFGTTPTR